MLVEENKAVVIRAFAEMDKQQSMAPLDEYAHPAYVAHVAGIPGPLDRDGMKQLGNSFYQAMPGLRHEPLAVIAEGDQVVIQLAVHGVHTGPLLTAGGTIPPTGRTIRADSMNIFRIEDHQAVEHWAVIDMLGMLQQLGVTP